MALIGDRDAECPALGGECGAAYLFAYKRGRWLPQEKLTASAAALADSFGVSVALSNSGSEALVGSDNAFCPSSPNCGSGYVFRIGVDDLAESFVSINRQTDLRRNALSKKALETSTSFSVPDLTELSEEFLRRF